MTANNETASQAALISRSDQFLHYAERALNMVAALSILFLMLLAVTQILGRTLFSLPIPGFIDFTEQAMVVFALLGVAYCQQEGGHIRMELLLTRLKGRGLWIFEMVTTLATLLLICGLVYGSWGHFVRAWTFGDSTIDIGLPIWPAKLLVPVALTALALRLAIQLAGYIRLCVHPQAQAVGVPLVEDVVEHAKHEIEETFGDDANNEEEAAR